MPKFIRMNLLKDSSTPVATVGITFNEQTKAVSFASPNGNDIQIDSAGDNDIQFNLTVNGSTGGSASIAGVSFPGTQPGGTHAPGSVFTPAAGTIPGQNPPVQIYGNSVGGNLSLTDNNNATRQSGTQEYDYCVWIRYQPPGNPAPAAEFYATDPKISNEAPPTENP